MQHTSQHLESTQPLVKPLDLFDGLLQLFGGFDHSPPNSARRASASALQPQELIVHVRQLFADFIYRTFSEDGEIARIFRKYVRSQGLNTSANVFDLFEALL